MSEKVLQQILSEVTTINKRMDSLETRFDKLEEEVEIIKSQTKEIPAMKVTILETNEAVMRIEKVQEEHESTLNILSRKYVDQEAKIKALSVLRAT